MAKMAIPERESDIQAAIRDYLQWTGWFCWKNHQTLGSYRGVADLTAIKDGRHLYIEVKTATGQLSEDQKKFRDDLVRAGGTYILARSVEDLEQQLKLMGVSRCGTCSSVNLPGRL